MSTITLESILDFLLEAPMFGDLDPTQLSKVVSIMQIQKLREGQAVFKEGDPGDAWYVIYEGGCDVLKESDVGRDLIATLGPRSCFGEMAILDGSSRSATVRATEESTLFRFPKEGMDELLAADELAAYKLIHQMALVLVARQRETTTALSRALHSGSVVGLEPIVERSRVTE